MSKKGYDWTNGAEIEDHTKKKHAVLRSYLREYLITRCQNPHQERFRLVFVDGFSGAGRYEDNSLGSPLIVVDELVKTTNEINSRRGLKGLRPVDVECLLILNDENATVIDLLKENIGRAMTRASDLSPRLTIYQEFHHRKFGELYPWLVARIEKARCSNVIFNLDQCGYTGVTSHVITDIMQRWRHAEVFLTFAIASLLAFLSPSKTRYAIRSDKELSNSLNELRKDPVDLLSKQEWLGAAERIVFEHFCRCAPYVSPFSINNPKGWRYWLMHFANSHRARQVYNNVLHLESAVQAHYGRAGLNMLSYDPTSELQLYLFDETSRDATKRVLLSEVPTLIGESGDALSVADFYASAYSATPAHTDDIHEAIIANPDIEVITESGGARRKAGAIKSTDTLKLKNQRSFFQLFLSDLTAEE